MKTKLTKQEAHITLSKTEIFLITRALMDAALDNPESIYCDNYIALHKEFLSIFKSLKQKQDEEQ